MEKRLAFELGFYGGDAADAEIDLYDVAKALVGFQRSLALTTHLILHDEIITKAPALKQASIYAAVPEEGSWKIPAYLAIAVTATTASHDTVLGHLVFSAYDLVIKQTLGFHVDFDKSLGQLYEELEESESEIPRLKEYRFDSLIEKCESSIADIHRPVAGRGSAEVGRIRAGFEGVSQVNLGTDFNRSTYDYVRMSVRSDEVALMTGSVSSYSTNQFSGRIYVPESGFPIPFRLQPSAQNSVAIAIITGSLSASAQRQHTGDEGLIYFSATRITSKAGRLKSLEIHHVSTAPY